MSLQVEGAGKDAVEVTQCERVAYNRSLLTLHSGGVCDGHAVLSGDLPLFLPAHVAGVLRGEQAVRFLLFFLCDPKLRSFMHLLHTHTQTGLPRCRDIGIHESENIFPLLAIN